MYSCDKLHIPNINKNDRIILIFCSLSGNIILVLELIKALVIKHPVFLGPALKQKPFCPQIVVFSLPEVMFSLSLSEGWLNIFNCT